MGEYLIGRTLGDEQRTQISDRLKKTWRELPPPGAREVYQGRVTRQAARERQPAPHPDYAEQQRRYQQAADQSNWECGEPVTRQAYEPPAQYWIGEDGRLWAYTSFPEYLHFERHELTEREGFVTCEPTVYEVGRRVEGRRRLHFRLVNGAADYEQVGPCEYRRVGTCFWRPMTEEEKEGRPLAQATSDLKVSLGPVVHGPAVADMISVPALRRMFAELLDSAPDKPVPVETLPKVTAPPKPKPGIFDLTPAPRRVLGHEPPVRDYDDHPWRTMRDAQETNERTLAAFRALGRLDAEARRRDQDADDAATA